MYSHGLTSLQTCQVFLLPSHTATYTHERSFQICGKWLNCQRNTFSQCSLSRVQHHEMLLVFEKAVISSWAKTRTLNTIWQVRVRHFQDSQEISHTFWAKAATAPLFLQMVCEARTQDTAQWHTEMPELPELRSGWCDGFSKAICCKGKSWYAKLALHIAIYA